MKLHAPLLAVSLAAACSAALATEYGSVISSTPVTTQVAVPQQQCFEQQAVVRPPTSGGGALLGALVGGVVGHNIGDGFGRAAATGLGVVAGSVIGDRTEAANTPATEVPMRTCRTVTGYESRVVGYDVTYDYNGQRYTARMAQPPGERIALNVNVAPAHVMAADTMPDTRVGRPVGIPVGTPVGTPYYGAAPNAVYAPAPVYAPYGYYGPYGYGGPAVSVMPSIAIGVGFGGYGRHGYWR